MRRKQDGVILLGALIITVFFMTVATAVAELGLNHYVSAKRTLVALNALSVAEAGAEKFMKEINADENYAGSGGEVVFYSDNVKGRGTYETTVALGTIPNEKVVISTGRIYLPASASTPLVTRKVRLVIAASNTPGYSAISGAGGLIMNNNSIIANGEVQVNGKLAMTGTARIGSATAPVNVTVAHQSCPTGGGSTYPVVCDNSSGQPISISTDAHIYGTVYATNQTNGSGMSHTGLVEGGTGPVLPMPTHDRAAQVAAVTTTIDGSTASCSGSQTKTWQANTRITGNVTMRNGCIITVMGDVWIDGSFTMSQSSQIVVGSGVVDDPSIMVDGANGIELNNQAAIVGNSNDVHFDFITYWSAAGCSPGCADVTGQALHDSQNIQTIYVNNASGASGVSFYSRWTKVVLNNSGSVGQVNGQTIQLDNSGNITFNATEDDTGPKVWDVKHYQQYYD